MNWADINGIIAVAAYMIISLWLSGAYRRGEIFGHDLLFLDIFTIRVRISKSDKKSQNIMQQSTGWLIYALPKDMCEIYCYI